ncbi:MAG: four helix bundle protein [Clostridia bacterium]|nr:four helix bundle protein [Clostridia bacterium]
MKEEKFKIIQFIKDLIIVIEKELINFPKKDIEIKNRIRTNTYDLLEICYQANATSNVEKKIELLEEAIAKIKVVDFLLNISYERELITHKKLIKIALKLDDIIKYISGWLKK